MVLLGVSSHKLNWKGFVGLTQRAVQYLGEMCCAVMEDDTGNSKDFMFSFIFQIEPRPSWTEKVGRRSAIKDAY